jgi:integrase
MAKIERTPSGKYTTRVYVGRDENGKQLFEYLTRDSWHECMEAVREIEEDVKNRNYTNVRNMPFIQYAREWLEIKRPELKPSTHKSYKMYIEYHFIPFFGNMKLIKITEHLCRRYFSDKLKTLSPETVRKHFFVLNNIFNDSLKLKNPCRDIKPPKRSDYKPYILSDEEFKLIHAAVKGTSDELPVLLAAWCGMREGEIFALRWDDIDYTNKTINIDETMSISEDGYVVGDPKSKNGIRTIIAPDLIFELIKERRYNQTVISPKIFNMRPDSYSKRFKGLIIEHNSLLKLYNAGKIVQFNRKGNGKYCVRRRSFNLQDKPLPEIRFHDLRHYHASVLYKSGISDQYAAERLGHDVIVLKKIYQHLQDDALKKEAEKVRDIFK